MARLVLWLLLILLGDTRSRKLCLVPFQYPTILCWEGEKQSEHCTFCFCRRQELNPGHPCTASECAIHCSIASRLTKIGLWIPTSPLCGCISNDKPHRPWPISVGILLKQHPVEQHSNFEFQISEAWIGTYQINLSQLGLGSVRAYSIWEWSHNVSSLKSFNYRKPISRVIDALIKNIARNIAPIS